MTHGLPSGAPRTRGTAVDLKPGDDHYRAYVGPPADYDLVAAMVFNLLTCTGLRQHHRVLDIGCGSLRVGRLLIPYLNEGHYAGIEPNRWLVEDGIANELGADMIRLKQPLLCFGDSPEGLDPALRFDVAIAQSIFSHCGQDLIHRWLSGVSGRLADDGALFATFLVDQADFAGDGWIYPGCVKFRPDTMARLAGEHGLGFRLLDWNHPRQQWALFHKPGYDTTLVEGPISWNRLVKPAGSRR